MGGENAYKIHSEILKGVWRSNVMRGISIYIGLEEIWSGSG
jgi:hypothetical protein